MRSSPRRDLDLDIENAPLSSHPPALHTHLLFLRVYCICVLSDCSTPLVDVDGGFSPTATATTLNPPRAGAHAAWTSAVEAPPMRRRLRAGARRRRQKATAATAQEEEAAAAAVGPGTAAANYGMAVAAAMPSKSSTVAPSQLGRSALRPAIYVYELPVQFNGWLLETRMHAQDCTYRRYAEKNDTNWENYAFGLEMALHEVLLASPHRTLNPEVADFFFVPIYGGCYISRFFRPSPLHNLIMAGTPESFVPAPVRGNQFYRDALSWIRQHHPYWERNGGRDHLFAFPHDEGACVAPIELENATMLTSWGRLQPRPQNATTTMVEHSWFVNNFVHQMCASEHQIYGPAQGRTLPYPHVTLPSCYPDVGRSDH